jgi:hypothetical protein
MMASNILSKRWGYGYYSRALAGPLVALLLGPFPSAWAQGTTFAYQGALTSAGAPASGSYDFEFRLIDSTNDPGTVVGGPLIRLGNVVSNGLFTVTLDFGAAVFNGAERFLEIRVRTNGVGAYEVLGPRQRITSTPYAITAATVASGGLAAGIYPSAVSLTNAANTLSGNGAGLTALNASQVLSGTLSDSRLSANVALLDADQTFSGTDTFRDARGKFSGDGANLRNLNLTLNSGGSFRPSGVLSAPSLLSVSAESFITAADVNGDGRLDLIAGSFQILGLPTTDIFVLTNNGVGGFVLASTPTVGNGPVGVAAADLNGDGWTDLITANQTAGNLSVLTNNRAGGFALASSPAVGDSPTSVAVADVNGDGRPDVIAAKWPGFGNGSLLILTNTGSGGTFALSATLNTGQQIASMVIAVDLNGDGKVDLVTANQSASSLTVLTNNGLGGFTITDVPTVGLHPFGIVAADVNGDSRLDLISANISSNSLSVLTNNGASGFGISATLPVGVSPKTVVAADLNGDGKVDLVCANSGSATLSIFTNNGSGGFAVAATPSVSALPGYLAAADFSGDGTPDIAVTHGNTNLVSILFNRLSFGGLLGGVIFVSTNGSVGIGTTTPAFQLQLSTDSAGKPNGGSWANSSDARVKKNIQPMKGALEKLRQLRGVRFEWINPEDHANQLGLQGGFIAQEVERVFPSWVKPIPADRHDKALTKDGDIKSLTLPFEFDALVVEAIKDLQQQIKARDETVRRLEQRVTELEKLSDASSIKSQP